MSTKHYVPVKIDTTDTRSAERIDVFEIDGVMYSMPAEVPGSTALGMLHQIRMYGQESAVSWALEEVLGKAAYDALRTCKGIKLADVRAVMKIVEDHVMGAVEDVEGKD